MANKGGVGANPKCRYLRWSSMVIMIGRAAARVFRLASTSTSIATSIATSTATSTASSTYCKFLLVSP